jgi:hypothetical protein
MTIYDNHGKVLWNKLHQPVTGGKGRLMDTLYTMGEHHNLNVQYKIFTSGCIDRLSFCSESRLVRSQYQWFPKTDHQRPITKWVCALNNQSICHCLG